jgi:hypothetical protein
MSIGTHHREEPLELTWIQATGDRAEWRLLESLDYIRGRIYLDQLIDYKLFKKEPAP